MIGSLSRFFRNRRIKPKHSHNKKNKDYYYAGNSNRTAKTTLFRVSFGCFVLYEAVEHHCRSPPKSRLEKFQKNLIGGTAMNNDDKTYKIYISDTEFEVSEEEYKEQHKIMEHSKYLRKEERKVTILSYEGLMEELNVDSIVADESVNVEERAITNVMIDELRKILKTLSKDELDLIDKIIYEEKSEREVADKYGISHTAVGKRWDKLCEKLRKLLERR